MSKGARLVERVKAHYSGLERRFLDVPEWGDADKPLRIWWKPMTLRDRQSIYRAGADGKVPDGATVNLRAVVLKALDGNGERLFGDIDEDDLMGKADGDVLAVLAANILNRGGKPQSAADRIDNAKNG